MGDTIVHSFVPIDQVESVADMATGTGCAYIYIYQSHRLRERKTNEIGSGFAK